MQLVSLVGEHSAALAPVYYSLFDRLEGHLILHDNAPWYKETANNLLKGMNAYETARGAAWRTEVAEMEGFTIAYDPAWIRAHLDKYAADQEVWLHCSNAPLALTLSWARAVFDRGGKAISYDLFENAATAIDGDFHSEPIAIKNLDIKTFCSLLNYKILQYDTRDTLQYKGEALLELFTNRKEQFDSYCDPRPVPECALNVRKIRNENPELLQFLIDCGFKFTIDSRHLFKQGRLFEEAVFYTVESLGFDDIALGVKIAFAAGVENEFDVLAIKDNHIYTIECKSGHVSVVAMIYKYDSIISYFGQDSKAIILKLKKADVADVVDERLRKRGLQNSILAYSLPTSDRGDFVSAVKTFFNL
jgi:hypothetical protein